MWRKSTTALMIGGVLVLVIATFVAFVITNFQPTTELRLGSGVFNARIADDQVSREKGLSGVTKLESNDAMLLVFDSDDKWKIWMKDMKVPIDIVWLDSERKVIYIVKDAQPSDSTDKSFVPSSNARYVVELPAGATSSHTIRIGEMASFALEQDGV